MPTVLLHADARADAHKPARLDLLERRLNRFRPQFQPRVSALASRHPRLKDLALSFPALLFALATPRPGFDPARAVAGVIDGARLPAVAALAGVPLWLRRVKPAAFGRPIPVLPDGDTVRRQIRNFLPGDPVAFDDWARAVADACTWADEAIAL